MNKNSRITAIIPLASCALLAACNNQWQPITAQADVPTYTSPYDIGYVSASPHVAEPSYVSALEAAMQEEQPETPHGKHSPRTISSTTQSALVQESGGIFGIPAGGTGITLLDTATRARLNDALSTTPTGQSVQWQSGELTYSLAPNSPVYIPQHSGGSCRDAVLSIYGDGFTNIRKRNLFCQAGPSSDWILVLEEIN